MNRAKLKKTLFDTYQAAIIISIDDRISSWAGLHTNPWLPVIFHPRHTCVVINEKEFKIDPDDWTIEGDQDAKMYALRTAGRGYHTRVCKPRGKYKKSLDKC